MAMKNNNTMKCKKTRGLYFRDNKDNVYYLNRDTKDMYFCCKLKKVDLELMTEDQLKPKRKI